MSKILILVVFLSFCHEAKAGKNGTALIGNKVYKLGVNSTNFSAKDLSYLLYTAAFDYCSNKTSDEIQQDLTTAVAKIKGTASVGLLQKLNTFSNCLNSSNSSLNTFLGKCFDAIVSNAKTGKICNSYVNKQTNMQNNKYACKKIVNTLFVYTSGAVSKDIVQAGITAAKKRSTTKEWSCAITAAKDFANVAAYNT